MNTTTSDRAVVTTACQKCDGKGSLICFRHRAGGVCYACNGTGRISDRRTAAQRAADENGAAKLSTQVGMHHARAFARLADLRAVALHITATGEQGWRTVTVEGKTAQFAARDGFIGYRVADADLIAQIAAQPKAVVKDCGRYAEITFRW